MYALKRLLPHYALLPGSPCPQFLHAVLLMIAPNIIGARFMVAKQSLILSRPSLFTFTLYPWDVPRPLPYHMSDYRLTTDFGIFVPSLFFWRVGNARLSEAFFLGEQFFSQFSKFGAGGRIFFDPQQFGTLFE